MLRLFARYTSVGVVNTAIHWAVFGALLASGAKQSMANLAAFCVAVTFSFFANAKWTFNAEATTARYFLYIFFMGAMAVSVGWTADRLHINPIVTLIFFSALSLVCGFVYSKFFVFRKS
ncbi:MULTISPECIES: GtrA family protein [Pantoea]|uniref:Bactoprenol-linked glucose translocase n=2 Tax=Pantoea TaxID=53335 RepID=A0A0U3UQ24_9GAMM|nr:MULTISPECIES: GtrA family protein [Pantoea]ALV91770.1 translocase [Pantoea vagans]KHJ69764.1 translocase [Pantoea rodasii]